MAYIGRDISNLSDRAVLDNITASATATYNLLLNSVAFVPSSAESLTVSLNGVIQKPQSSYTVSGSTIVFDSALTSSDVIDFILAERAITLTTVGSGSVGTSQLVDGSVSNAKLENSSITLNGSAVSLGGSATIGGGKIGQVVSTFVNTVVSITSTSTTDVTGMSVSITPSATSSKILVINDAKFGCSTGNLFQVSMFRDSTEISGGNNSGIGSRSTGIFQADGSSGVIDIFNTSTTFLDSPNSTSSLTYKLRGRVHASGPTLKLNATGADRDPNDVRTGSSITVMEILA